LRELFSGRLFFCFPRGWRAWRWENGEEAVVVNQICRHVEARDTDCENGLKLVALQVAQMALQDSARDALLILELAARTYDGAPRPDIEDLLDREWVLELSRQADRIRLLLPRDNGSEAHAILAAARRWLADNMMLAPADVFVVRPCRKPQPIPPASPSESFRLIQQRVDRQRTLVARLKDDGRDKPARRAGARHHGIVPSGARAVRRRLLLLGRWLVRWRCRAV
jgi:hypothetical protein